MNRYLTSYIRWREDEEDNRLSSAPNPDRAVRVTSLPCAGGCGHSIVEVITADGTRRFDQDGICSGMGKVWHRGCPNPLYALETK